MLMISSAAGPGPGETSNSVLYVEFPNDEVCSLVDVTFGWNMLYDLYSTQEYSSQTYNYFSLVDTRRLKIILNDVYIIKI